MAFNENRKELESKKASREKSKATIELMSADEYRAKNVQPIINEIVRLIDKEQTCIATGNKGKMSAGHYHSTGSNRTLTLNLHNIHRQSYSSNSCKAGDHINYRHGLIKEYGENYADFVDMHLLQCRPIHLSKADLMEIKANAQQIRNDLKKINKIYSAQERIDKRNEINALLNVYSAEFGVFEK